MIRAGNLREQVTIQRDRIDRENGVETRTLETLAENEPAKGEALTGNELWRAQQVNSVVTWRWTFRWQWFGKLKSSDRIIWPSRSMRFEIVAIIPDMMRRDSVEVHCKNLNA